MSTQVVAAAIVEDGRVLAARRRRDRRWEFPGGKVETGESDPQALARECREELGVGIGVGGRVAAAQDGIVELRVYAAVLTGARPVPGADHDEMRWLRAAELSSVDWLPLDRAVLDAVAGLLQPDRTAGEA